MRNRSGTSALVAALLVGTVGLSTRAAAQEAPARTDSTPHFALFGGWAPIDGQYVVKRGVAMGASGDFRLSPIPVPLRFSLSFDERTGQFISRQRGAQASLDLVMRPIAKRFGIQPYFLGGLGVATRTEYTEWAYTSWSGYSNVQRPRQTWAFASVGAGLDIGRAFIQVKAAQPIASEGPGLIPISVGFRFWE